MQKRFCTCGQQIWVQYLLSGFAWKALFITNEYDGSVLLTCPHCGQPLNINDLF